MARQARNKSESGIYQVMLGDNERKSVFLDGADKNIIEVSYRAVATKLIETLVRKNGIFR